MSSLISAPEAALPLSTLPLEINSENTAISPSIPELGNNTPQLLQTPTDLDSGILNNTESTQLFDPLSHDLISDSSLITLPTHQIDQPAIIGAFQTAPTYELTADTFSYDSLHDTSVLPDQTMSRIDNVMLGAESLESIVSPPSTQQLPEYSSLPSSLDNRGSSQNQLIIIDSKVDDYDGAIAAIDSNAEVFVLDPSIDGIEQITQLLSTRSQLDSLHIISHGNSGQLELGSTVIDQGNIQEYSDRLQTWSSAFSESADILLYGCNVAHGQNGQAFIDQLSGYTGTDIAASTDYTGNDAKSADWDLEYTTGSIETDIALPKEFTASYQGVLNSPIRVEAEKLDRSGYRIESSDSASGGELLSLRGKGTKETGKASLKFKGSKGYYDVVVGYFDENDGQASLQVSHKNKNLDRWSFDKQLGSSNTSSKNLVRRTVASELKINPGDKFELKGYETRNEHARIDYIEFIPRTQATQNDPTASKNSVTDKPLTIKRIEAEDIQRSNYRLESNEAASGGSLLSLRGRKSKETGTASFKFNGTDGRYNVVLAYVDENDGTATLQVNHENNTLSSWKLDKQLGSNRISKENIVRRTVAKDLDLESGDSFQIKGFEQAEEHARIDYIEFIPIDDSNTSTDNDDSNSPDPNTPEKESDKGSKQSKDPVSEPNEEPIDDPTPPPKQPSSPPPKVDKNPNNSKLIFEDTFSGNISKAWGKPETAKAHSLNIVKDPTGRSGDVARFELRKTDPLVAGNYRSELSGPRTPVNSEMWYGFSTLLPSDWKTDPTNEIITQWHGAPDKSKGETWESKGGPPLSIHIDGNEMYVKANWNTGSGKKTNILWRGNYQKGDWMDWVVHTKWSNSSNGYIQIWKDDKLIVDHKGPNTHHDQSGGIYLKTGLYKYSWKQQAAKSTTNTRVLYVDQIRVGDKNANYGSVTPS